MFIKIYNTLIRILYPLVISRYIKKRKENGKEDLIRDYCDHPILRAAIQAGAYIYILLTGDKDFLDSGIKTPRVMTPAQFMNL